MDSIVLLGTGCPSPSHERFGPSTLVTSGNQNILIDAGSGVTQRLSEHGLKPSAIDIILDSIVEAVALDEKVEIRGFGTFSKKFIRPRKFINPKTKKVSYVGETSTMHFKPSKSLIKK